MGDQSKMVMSVREVYVELFIKKYACHLQKQGKIKIPIFLEHVKTASARAHAPSETIWWYLRIASIARRIHLKQGIGVEKFRHIFGGSKQRGSKPSHHVRAAGNIIRK